MNIRSKAPPKTRTPKSGFGPAGRPFDEEHEPDGGGDGRRTMQETPNRVLHSPQRDPLHVVVQRIDRPPVRERGRGTQVESGSAPRLAGTMEPSPWLLVSSTASTSETSSTASIETGCPAISASSSMGIVVMPGRSGYPPTRRATGSACAASKSSSDGPRSSRSRPSPPGCCHGRTCPDPPTSSIPISRS